MTPKSEHEEILAPAHGSEAPGAEKTLGQVMLDAAIAFGKSRPSFSIGADPSAHAAHMNELYDVMAKAIVAEHERRKGTPLQSLDVRQEVRAFALLMEQELRANEHKGGWKGDEARALAYRVQEEADELVDAVVTFIQPARTETDREARRAKVASEAADVANMAMMVADVCDALPALPTAAKAGG